MSPLTPVLRRSVVDEAHDALRAQILHGSWKPGDKVPTEAALTEQLGVGRGTVREALNRLASAGLIEIPHGGSKRVRDFRDHAGLEILPELVVSPAGAIDVAVVRSVVEMRAAIAPDIARLAALRRTDAQAEALATSLAQLDARLSLEEQWLRVIPWWTNLVLASGNLAYRLAYNTLLGTYAESRPVLLAIIDAEVRALPVYSAITDAVLASEAPLAEERCRALIDLGNTALFRALDAYTGA